MVVGHLLSIKVLDGASHISFSNLSYAHTDWQGRHKGAWPANDGEFAPRFTPNSPSFAPRF